MPDDIRYEDDSLPQLMDVIRGSAFRTKTSAISTGELAHGGRSVAERPRGRQGKYRAMALDPTEPLWENEPTIPRGARMIVSFTTREKKLSDSARFIGVPALEVRVTEHTKRCRGGQVFNFEARSRP